MDGAADLVLRGGHVLTFAEWTPGADAGAVSAVAVRDGLIVATGHDAEMEPLIGPSTRVVDLGGRCVIPGINDTHLHVVCYAMASFGLQDLSGIDDWGQLERVLTPEARGDDGWIRAQGWDAGALGRLPTAADVDAALAVHGSIDTPAVLFDRTGHQLLVSTSALRRLGIDAATPDPDGGVVVRDEGGAPTGVFTDAATALVLGRLPPVPVATLSRVLRRAQARLAELGITSVTDPGIGPGHATLFDGSASPLALDALADLASSGELTLRTSVLLTFSGTGGESVGSIRAGLESGVHERFAAADPRMLRVAGIKVFADGIQRSGTAWHHEPYGPHGARGQLAVAGADDAGRVTTLRGILGEIGASGLQAGVHATGDAASDAVVAALRDVPAEHRGRRPYLIHGDFLTAASMASLAEAGIGWTANPVISTMVAGIGLALLGAERQSIRQPLGSALRAGVTVTLSSDAPVVSPDWREAVITAVERTQTDGLPHPESEEAVSAVDALAMLTVTPARLDVAESFKGRLAPGFVADLAVLSRPWPEDADVRALRLTSIDLTVMDGRIVHESGA